MSYASSLPLLFYRYTAYIPLTGEKRDYCFVVQIAGQCFPNSIHNSLRILPCISNRAIIVQMLHVYKEKMGKDR
jgi:hypothetical protein